MKTNFKKRNFYHKEGMLHRNYVQVVCFNILIFTSFSIEDRRNNKFWMSDNEDLNETENKKKTLKRIETESVSSIYSQISGIQSTDESIRNSHKGNQKYNKKRFQI